MKIKRADTFWIALMLALVAATSAYTRREIVRRHPAQAESDLRTIASGAQYQSAGILVGDSTAPVKIVEFFDFECLHCRRLYGTMTEAIAAQPRSVAIIYRHFPLSGVGFALPAAIAAECAAAQGRFDEFAAIMFSAQDSSLSRVALEIAAIEAGVRDTAQFHTCRSGARPRARVAEDIAAGERLGVTGTPTFLVGDQVFAGEVTRDRLNEIIHTAMQNHRVH